MAVPQLEVLMKKDKELFFQRLKTIFRLEGSTGKADSKFK
jgi:hypothetical protein